MISQNALTTKQRRFLDSLTVVPPELAGTLYDPVSTNWLDDAECKPGGGVDPHTFDDRLDSEFETKKTRDNRHRRARLICSGCPVRQPCLADAKAGDGIRGGQLFQYPRSEDREEVTA